MLRSNGGKRWRAAAYTDRKRLSWKAVGFEGWYEVDPPYTDLLCCAVLASEALLFVGIQTYLSDSLSLRCGNRCVAYAVLLV